MSLPRPILDDRSYQQLRDELVRRIPVYNPEWTDHNASDPGITLLELFAFLGENVLFRFNQIPEATRLAFLELLDVPLRPAQPARALLALSNDSNFKVVAGAFSRATAGEIAFETEDEVASFKVDSAAFLKHCEAAPPTGTEEGAAADQTTEAAQLNGTETPAYYRTQSFPPDPAAGPVDPGCTVDGALWVAVLSDDPVTDLPQLSTETLNVGVLVDGTTLGLDELARTPLGCSDCGPVAQPSVSDKIELALPACRGVDPLPPTDVLWHCSTGVLTDGVPSYRLLKVAGDSTSSLSQSGVVRLTLPEASTLGTFALADPQAEGTRDLPPRIEDDELKSKVMFWLRATRRDGRPLPKLRWAGVNAVMVVQSQQGGAALLGQGTAQPGQQVTVLNVPVLEKTLVLQVERLGRFEPWTEVDSFDASTESDPHFVLDPQAGKITFGDGIRGRAPQLGERIRVLKYRYGGGAAGNVAPGAISKLLVSDSVTVKNPMRAFGGADAEPIEEALERVPSELRRHDRAVTSTDFSELARATPGADVARAETMARFYPPLFQPDTPGVVTVVVWPRTDPEHPAAPRPDRTTLDRVCAFLDQRRPITTELWVIPPSYVEVAVSLGLRVKPGFGIEGVRQWVEQVIHQYLSPLPPYGPDGTGWPLGRPVDARELIAAALQVDGVLLIEGVTLAWRAGPDAAWTTVGDPPVVPLAAWQVPELTVVSVVEGAPLSPTATVAPPAPPKVPVPIPVLKEEC
ncbi:MAG: putative baseplate assembly protein [Myxococcaceae bacterium]